MSDDVDIIRNLFRYYIGGSKWFGGGSGVDPHSYWGQHMAFTWGITGQWQYIKCMEEGVWEA